MNTKVRNTFTYTHTHTLRHTTLPLDVVVAVGAYFRNMEKENVCRQVQLERDFAGWC